MSAAQGRLSIVFTAHDPQHWSARAQVELTEAGDILGVDFLAEELRALVQKTVDEWHWQRHDELVTEVQVMAG